MRDLGCSIIKVSGFIYILTIVFRQENKQNQPLVLKPLLWSLNKYFYIKTAIDWM